MKPPENLYVIAGKDGLIFDAGYGTAWTLKHAVSQIKKVIQKYKEKELPCNITRALPSHVHPDHFSGLKKLRRYLGVNVMLTEQMADIIKDKESYLDYYRSDITLEESYELKSPQMFLSNHLRKASYRLLFNLIYGITFIPNPDVIINKDTTISINGECWDIFPSPGHSSDHISLYNEEKGILFSGDNVLRTVTTWLGPPNSDIEKYLETIKKMQELPNLKLILPSHGSPVTNPRERLEEILVHRHNKTQQVLELIQESGNKGITLQGLLERLYPNKGTFMHGVARGWVILTLRMLWSQNQIEYKIRNSRLKFFPP